MVQAPQKAIVPEAASRRTTLPPPRFDEVAEQTARPVVPLAAESVSANPGAATNRGSQRTPLLSKKGLWVLAGFVGLMLTVGALAININTYRRSPAVSTESLIPVVDAVQLELNQAPRQAPRPARSSESRESRESSATPVIVQTRRRVQPAQPASDGKPRARLVDSYVIPR